MLEATEHQKLKLCDSLRLIVPKCHSGWSWFFFVTNYSRL